MWISVCLIWLAPLHALEHDITDIGFALERIQPHWIVEFAFAPKKNSPGPIICGTISRKHIIDTEQNLNFTYHISVEAKNMHCTSDVHSIGDWIIPMNTQRENSESPREVSLNLTKTTWPLAKQYEKLHLIAIRIKTTNLDYYLIQPATRLEWRSQINSENGSFIRDARQISDFETRSRPSFKFPLTYFPELGLTSGISGFPSGKKYYWENQFSADYRPENFLHAHILFDFSYAGASTDENATLILPDRLLKTALGFGWRFPINTWLALDFALSGVSIFYRYLSAESDWAHRPGIRFKLGLDFPILRANRDFHKLSILLEPYALGILNKTPFSVDWTYQLGALIGLRYAY